MIIQVKKNNNNPGAWEGKGALLYVLGTGLAKLALDSPAKRLPVLVDSILACDLKSADQIHGVSFGYFYLLVTSIYWTGVT
jgi:hypothetical protein